MKASLFSRLGARRFVFPALAGFLCLYFCFHLAFGQRSIPGYFAMHDALAQKQAELVVISAERVALEGRVASMRPGQVSKDMLEERARIVLGYTAPEEMVLLTAATP